MKKSFVFFICLFLLFSVRLQANNPQNDDNFASVVSFENYTDMQEFMSENGFDDVFACSDAVGNAKLIMVIPATKQIKLELYHAAADKYGNVDPVYDNPLSNAEVGQPIYFALPCDTKDSKLAVVAVDGVGRRSVWSPVFDNSGRLGINSDFKCFSPVSVSKANTKVKDFIDYENYGVSFKVDKGRVTMNLYDVEKYKKNRLGAPAQTNLVNGVYGIHNIDGDCQGLFIGDVGQDTNPVLCILLYDNTVEVMSVSKSIDNAFLMSSGRIKGQWDIVDFENSGGGAYENQGQTMYSYITIYGIDSGKHKTEIELFPLGYEKPYTANNGKKLLLLEDYTLAYFDNNVEYRGTYRYKAIDIDKSIYEISYKFIRQRNLNTPSLPETEVEIEGVFNADMSSYTKTVLTPVSGLDFGVGYGNRIIFSMPGQ